MCHVCKQLFHPPPRHQFLFSRAVAEFPPEFLKEANPLEKTQRMIMGKTVNLASCGVGLLPLGERGLGPGGLHGPLREAANWGWGQQLHPQPDLKRQWGGGGLESQSPRGTQVGGKMEEAPMEELAGGKLGAGGVLPAKGPPFVSLGLRAPLNYARAHTPRTFLLRLLPSRQ